MIETRNGSNQVLKQQVWGPSYVDHLVQVAVNQDPSDANEQACERFFWACRDSNFNVLGLVDNKGAIIERYEYTPYGERTVFARGWLAADVNTDGWVNLGDWNIVAGQLGSSDPATIADVNGDGQVTTADTELVAASFNTSLLPADALATCPTHASTRVTHSNVPSAVPLCEFGHQGLMHDEELGLVFNRARVLHPMMGRFMQRDPLGYVDGLSLYAAYHILRGGLDPFGLEWDPAKPNWHHMLPQEFRDKLGDMIDDAEFGRMMTAADHQALHRAGWNPDWNNWLATFEKQNKLPCKDELIGQMNRMKALDKYKALVNKGFQARIGFKEWSRRLAGYEKAQKEVAERLAKLAKKKTGKRIAAAIPGISLAISLWDLPARAKTYGTGNALGMTVLDNVPIVDIALSGAEMGDQMQEAQRREGAKLQWAQQQLIDDAKGQ